MLASAKAVNARVAFFCSPLLYHTVAEHYETWLELASAGQFDGQGDHHTPKPFVRKAFANAQARNPASRAR